MIIYCYITLTTMLFVNVLFMYIILLCIQDINTILKSTKSHINCIVLQKGDNTTNNNTNEKSKTLYLSMRNSLINRGILFKHIQKGFPIKGCIESIEDHGLV